MLAVSRAIIPLAQYTRYPQVATSVLRVVSTDGRLHRPLVATGSLLERQVEVVLAAMLLAPHPLHLLVAINSLQAIPSAERLLHSRVATGRSPKRQLKVVLAVMLLYLAPQHLLAAISNLLLVLLAERLHQPLVATATPRRPDPKVLLAVVPLDKCPFQLQAVNFSLWNPSLVVSLAIAIQAEHHRRWIAISNSHLEATLQVVLLSAPLVKHRQPLACNNNHPKVPLGAKPAVDTLRTRDSQPTTIAQM